MDRLGRSLGGRRWAKEEGGDVGPVAQDQPQQGSLSFAFLGDPGPCLVGPWPIAEDGPGPEAPQRRHPAPDRLS